MLPENPYGGEDGGVEGQEERVRHPSAGTDAVSHLDVDLVLLEAEGLEPAGDGGPKGAGHGSGLVLGLVVGFEHLDMAQRFYADLRERFAKFGLELHPEKTRLIEFGRHAAERRRARGLGKPETFDYLGLTHLCGKTRTGRTGRFCLNSGQERQVVSERFPKALHKGLSLVGGS